MLVKSIKFLVANPPLGETGAGGGGGAGAGRAGGVQLDGWVRLGEVDGLVHGGQQVRRLRRGAGPGAGASEGKEGRGGSNGG